ARVGIRGRELRLLQRPLRGLRLLLELLRALGAGRPPGYSGRRVGTPGVLQSGGVPVPALTRVRVMTGLGLLALGAGAAAFVVARSFQEDADRSDPSISLLLKQTPWAPPDAVSRIARLERLSTHPSLDDAEAGFLLESLARAVPDVDASQRDVPISESPQAQAWFLANHEVIVARGIAVKALRDGWPIPDRARDSIEHIL